MGGDGAQAAADAGGAGIALSPSLLAAHALAEELGLAGVRHAVVCPGNRSGPLAFALAEQPMRLWSQVDERSAGYFALGLARASGSPVVVACTSGTAAANLLPAAVEAWHARVPLVLVTADRPRDLRDVGANQAVHQAGLFGAHARWACDLPEPSEEPRALRLWRASACRAVAEAWGPPAGPVHLNAPFTKPLEPAPGAPPPARAERPFLGATRRAPRPLLPEARAALRGALGVERGLVVLGPQDDAELAGLAAELSMRTGFPLLADPLGQARFGGVADVALGGYDAALSAMAMPAPQRVVRLGAAPTSDALLRWLEGEDVPQLVFDDAPWREPALLPGARLDADPKLALRALLEDAQCSAEPGWGRAWRAAEQAVRAAHEPALGSWFEGSAVAAVLDALPAGSTLFVGNSLPVRDLDRFGQPRRKALRVLGNRGASGIDGVTSTALGARAGSDAPLCLVTGDVSFLHDLPGLLALKRHRLAACIVVLHNDGGRIFDQLPAAGSWSARVRDLFVTPHGLGFRHAAELFGAGFARVEDAKGLRDEVLRGVEQPGGHVVEARIDPQAAQRARHDARQAVERALRAA